MMSRLEAIVLFCTAWVLCGVLQMIGTLLLVLGWGREEGSDGVCY